MIQGHLLPAIAKTCTKQLIELNCLLKNLTRSEQYSEALQIFHQIHSSHHLRPDHYTLSPAITACANLRDTTIGTQLQAYAIRSGLNFFPHVRNTLLFLYSKSQDLGSVKKTFSEIQDPDVYSWTTLLSACTKLGDVGYACHVFDLVQNRNVAIWNAMITGCGKSGYDEIALDKFKKMLGFGVGHDYYSLASVLSLCSLELFDFGRQVHSLIIKIGFLARTSVVNALLTMYFNCERIADAYRVFDEEGIIVQDQITYNAMIDGLVSMERDEETFFMFKTMLAMGLMPTDLSFVSTMSSCSCERIAIQLHALAVKLGFEDCTSVSNAAIKMYSNCENLYAAYLVFQRLEEKDTVSWNTMITSYSLGNRGKDAILVYLQMQRECIRPDLFTIGSLLVSSEVLVVVETIQASVIKNALILETGVSNALLSAFSKHGHIRQAYQIFHEMNSKNLISWNTLINGHQLNEYPLQGLDLFSQLVSSGLVPNVYTLSIILSVCASISALQYGEQVHACILKLGYSFEASLNNALITLYAKCGLLNSSLRVFQNMMEKDVVTWNSMISAYAQHGKGREAVLYFEMMQNSGVKLDKATFTAVLSACSHSGLLADGIRIFNSLVNYGIEPEVDHFSCIVDLLGRAGYLDEAENLLNDKLVDIDSRVWWTLFSSCAAHGNLRLGRIVAGILLEAEQHNPTVYVNLSNICANLGNWKESAYLRDLMKKHGGTKQPGSSWIGS